MMKAEKRWSLMSRPALLRAVEEGDIFVSPYTSKCVRPNSIDVTFGPWIWREKAPDEEYDAKRFSRIYNPYDKDEVESIFVKERAKPLQEIVGEATLKGISPDDKVVMIQPGESILGHTNEFIGSACNHITTTMFARSSAGRNFLEVCRCAGQGDIGYCNRWTMEITNNSRFYTIPLVVGRRIAQLEFFETEPLEASDYAEGGGKYQTTADLDKMMESWKPEDMLPKMYADWEAKGL